MFPCRDAFIAEKPVRLQRETRETLLGPTLASLLFGLLCAFIAIVGVCDCEGPRETHWATGLIAFVTVTPSIFLAFGVAPVLMGFALNWLENRQHANVEFVSKSPSAAITE